MQNQIILIGSQAEPTITAFQNVADEIDINLCIKRKIEDLLISLQENDYNAVVFDMDLRGLENLKTLRLIKNLRPKLPLITIASDVDKKLGGQIFDIGVFHLIMSPPSKESIKSVLKAITKL